MDIYELRGLLHFCFLSSLMLFRQLFLKIFGGMTKSVDSDQTAPSYAVLSEILVYKILGHLTYSMMNVAKFFLLPGFDSRI